MYSIIDTTNNNILAIGLDFAEALLVRNSYEVAENRLDFELIDEEQLLNIW